MMEDDPQLLRNQYDKVAVILGAFHKKLATIIKDNKNYTISPYQAKSLAKANKMISRVHFELDNTALMAYGLKYKQEHRIGDPLKDE